jgi:hypothetical protein
MPLCTHAGREALDHRENLGCIGAGSDDPVLRLAQTRRGDKLHRAGYLLDASGASDAPSYVANSGHGNPAI